jgi:hypothetical protein
MTRRQVQNRTWHVGTGGRVEGLFIEAPGGLAGNLLVASLVRAGVPKPVVNQIPPALNLEGFRVVWDDYGVCDGEGGSIPGNLEDLTNRVRTYISAEVAAVVENAIRILHPDSDAVGSGQSHVVCDTVFDVTAFFTGLETLGWPTVSIVGPLPSTNSDHPLIRLLLPGWEWKPVRCNLELVTPTAGTILQMVNAHQVGHVPPDAVMVGEVSSRFNRQCHLEPVQVWAVYR